MIFGWRDMALAIVLGIAFTAWYKLRRERRQRTERPIARMLSAILEPLYYWCDLTGADGRPSHSKVLYFAGAVVLLSGVLLFGRHQFEHRETVSLAEGLSWSYLAYVALTGVYVSGKFAFNAMMARIAGQFGEKFDTLLRKSERASGAIQRPPEVESP